MMTIVSWNCRNGFTQAKSNKLFSILSDTNNAPDIFIIQECYSTDIEKITFENKTWFGDGKDGNLGIGIFSKKYKIERALEHNINFRYMVPYYITNIISKKYFVLFAVWTKNICCDYPYIGQVYGAINYSGYKKLLNEDVVIIGDFNANQIWDDDNKKINNPTFLDVVNRFNEKGIYSNYHKQYSCEYGNEIHKTHFNASTKKFYHIDYCFSSENMKFRNIIIADENEWEKKDKLRTWKNLSDHSPLIVDFDY
jgi:endonuclease/exonuclease/phosphatase family metal-dependent hydrolase